MKHGYLLIAFCCLSFTTLAQTTYFQQNFSAGGDPSTYVNSTSPTNGQFTELTSTGGVTLSTSNTYLEFVRPATASGQGRFVRAVDFSPVPASLYIQFSLEVLTTENTTSVATFFFGSGPNFTNTGTLPANAEVYSKISINFAGGTTANQFAIRDVLNNRNSPAQPGKQTITWVLNNTGSTLTYVTPSGGTETVANDTYDLFIGNTRVFNDLAVQTGTVDIRRFKFLFNNGVGNIRLDDFLIRDVSGVLPVELISFGAKTLGDHVDLTWTTAWERNAERFVVQRSRDLLEFADLGEVKAKGSSETRQTYGFTDTQPLLGVSYYRLKQVDFNGTVNYSKAVAADVQPNGAGVAVYPNPSDGRRIDLRLYNTAAESVQVHSFAGQAIAGRFISESDTHANWQPEHPLPSGIYLLRIQDGLRHQVVKVLVK